MNKQKIITWILFLLVFLTIAQVFKKKPESAPTETAVKSLVVSPLKTEYSSGEEIIVKIHNQTGESVALKSNCPKNPLRVLAFTGEKFAEKTTEAKMSCELAPDVTLAQDQETKISYKFWNYSLFGQPGRYKIEVPLTVNGKQQIFTSQEFTVVEAGAWRKFFRAVFYQPIYNVLVFFVNIAPARDLGLAIILLTLFTRLLLLIPSQKALISQRRMQELQPKLEHIKKTYAGNQERIAQETMKLWKDHKVNPFGSCLPLIIQFPVLIALFYVIQNGLHTDTTYMLYSPLKDVDLSNIHTNFLGILELTRVNAFVLPIIVGVLQFFQLKLTTMKKKAAQTEESKPTEMESANKMMTYVMPVMIALFTASVPAGVGLYWGISTVFGIGQQLVVNRKKP